MTGDILRKRREDLGLDINVISDLLKIRVDYLKWIEGDCFEKLPAPVYTMGYIRCYAQHLGVDADSIIQYYNEHLSKPKSAAIMPVGFSQKKSPVLVYVILIALTVLIAVILILKKPWKQDISKQRNAGNISVQQPAVTTPGITHAVVPVPEKKAHSLEITASEKTWVMIKLSDGKREEVMLQAGESKKYNFTERLSVRIGNAGGLKLNFDGKDIGAPGSKGQVVTMTFPQD